MPPLLSSKAHSPCLEPFVSAVEAARFLSLHPKTLQKYSRSGLVPAHPFGEGHRKHWRYLLSEVDLWLRARSGSGPRRNLAADRRLATAVEPVDFSKQLR